MRQSRQWRWRVWGRAGAVLTWSASLGLGLPPVAAPAQVLGGMGRRGGGPSENAPAPSPPPPAPAPPPAPEPSKPEPAPPPAPAAPAPSDTPAPTDSPAASADAAPPPSVPAPTPGPPTPSPPLQRLPPTVRILPLNPPPAAPGASPGRTAKTGDGAKAGERTAGPAPAVPGRSVRATAPVGTRPRPPRHEGRDGDGPTPVFVPVLVPVPVEAPAYPTTVPTPPLHPPPPLYPPAPVPPIPTPRGPRALSSDAAVRAALADIEQAWRGGDLALLRRHIRDDQTQIAVFRQGRYEYSLTGRKFLTVTQAAFRHLRTLEYRFTGLRRLPNGDLAASGTHVYRVIAGGAKRTVRVTDTLSFLKGRWVLVAVDTDAGRSGQP